MPHLAPISRQKLIKALRSTGFEGPYSGGKHQYMVRGDVRLVIPNPHGGDISAALLSRILRQADISREEWEQI